jgi:hypothetical protein
MPAPTQADLHRRALANATRDNTAQFGPLAILVLGAILSAVISHLVAKCLNHIDPITVRSPGPFRRWQLRRLIRERCGDVAVLEAARQGGLDAAALDRAYGDAAHAALLATGAGLSEPEAMGLTKGAPC